MLGAAGVHRYDSRARHWRMVAAAQPTAHFAETDGARLHVALPDRVLTLAGGRVVAEAELEQPLRQILPGDGAALFGLDRSGRILALDGGRARVLAPADGGAPADARFTHAVAAGELFVALGPQGALVHDPRGRRYSFTPAAGLPPLPLENALVVAGDSARIWIVPRDGGEVRSLTIGGEFPAKEFVVEAHGAPGVAIVQARATGQGIDLVAADGQVARLALSAQGSAVGTLAGPAPRGALRPVTMADAGDRLLFSDGAGLWAYAAATRSWSGPAPPSPPGRSFHRHRRGRRPDPRHGRRGAGLRAGRRRMGAGLGRAGPRGLRGGGGTGCAGRGTGALSGLGRPGAALSARRPQFRPGLAGARPRRRDPGGGGRPAGLDQQRRALPGPDADLRRPGVRGRLAGRRGAGDAGRRRRPALSAGRRGLSLSRRRPAGWRVARRGGARRRADSGADPRRGGDLRARAAPLAGGRRAGGRRGQPASEPRRPSGAAGSGGAGLGARGRDRRGGLLRRRRRGDRMAGAGRGHPGRAGGRRARGAGAGGKRRPATLARGADAGGGLRPRRGACLGRAPARLCPERQLRRADGRGALDL